MRYDAPAHSMDPAARALLIRLFEAAVTACQPGPALKRALAADFLPTVHVLSVGKAGNAMARAASEALPSIVDGLVICHADAPAPEGFEHIRAEHPVPGAGSVRGGEAALAMADRLGADDILLVLLSGGSSSLMSAPADGLALSDIQALTTHMLRSGAPIGDINCVRRHLSRIKGGRLAQRAAPARVITLAVSDVVGDGPSDIGSGPTVGDATTLADARAVLDRYTVPVVDTIKQALSDPANETVFPDDPCLAGSRYSVIVSARRLLEAAALEVSRAAFKPIMLSETIEGDAETVARAHAEIALGHAQRGERVALLSGGELTIQVPERAGAGGPNQHYALTVAEAVDGHRGIHVLAADTDGKDGVSVGTQDHAGALVGPGTLARARAAGYTVRTVLKARDSGTVLARLGDALITGVTGTNVNDFRVILVDGQAR